MTDIVLATLQDAGAKFGTHYDWTISANPVTGEYWNRSIRETGDMFSVGHRRSPDGKYRSGGPFYSIKFRTETTFTPKTVFRNGYRRAYYGGFAPNWTPGQLYDYSALTMWGSDTDRVNSLAYAYGAQAYDALRPDKPDYSPLTSLAELGRELPGIIEEYKNFNKRYHAELRRKRKSRIFLSRSGKNHLAIQFGIMPIISDVMNWMEAYKNAEKRARQLLRDNGKWVRRKRFLTPKPGTEYTTTSVVNKSTPNHPDVVPYLVTQCYGGGTMARTEESYLKFIEVWAVGKSKYWLPDDILKSPLRLDILKRRNHTDLSFTLETLYNLVPWSWFVDYFFGLGHFIAAISNGGIGNTVVFEYAYVMRREHHSRRTKYVQYVYKDASGGTTPVTSNITKTGDLKSRVAASLFGFGLVEQDLSPVQLGILGALGLSKL
nr:MAG: hypothetical protein 1 [Leviviridae sp.]